MSIPSRLPVPACTGPDGTPVGLREMMEVIRYLTAAWLQPNFALGYLALSAKLYIEKVYRLADEALKREAPAPA